MRFFWVQKASLPAYRRRRFGYGMTATPQGSESRMFLPNLARLPE